MTMGGRGPSHALDRPCGAPAPWRGMRRTTAPTDRRNAAMRIVRAAERATKPAPAANFTGTVFQDEVVVGVPPSRLRASVVSFTPGARTAWHAHPVGQTLYCLSGVGRVQREG